MDQYAFDLLTRSLIAIRPRRALLRAMAAGVGALAVSQLGTTPAAARCKKLGRPCDRRRDTCCDGGACKGRTCRCTGGKRACRGKCIRPNQCCVNADCNGGVCRNNACDQAPNQGICTAEFNVCSTQEAKSCGPGCSCYVTQDGLSFCGRNAIECGCGANNDCAQHGPGAVCVRQEAGCCTFAGNNTCALPCPDPD